MKRSIVLTAVLTFQGFLLAGQTSGKYFEYVDQAKSSYERKEYKRSAQLYASAFKLNAGKAYCDDRYNAARSWAMIMNKDSAFRQLFKVATLYDYTNYNEISSEPAFNGLHNDKRWKEVTDLIKQNIGRTDSKLNSTLVVLLDSVYRSHHSMRLLEVTVRNQFGAASKELKDLRAIIRLKDSVNLMIVEGIISKYGWLGKDVVGFIGNYTLALILQDAGRAVQEKYIPMVREAFKNGKVEPYDYSLLEDRLALRQGKKQLYGNVILNLGGKNYVAPVEDPDNLDKKRKELGLRGMSEYLSNWNLKWDVVKYKKDLVFLEKESISY